MKSFYQVMGALTGIFVGGAIAYLMTPHSPGEEMPMLTYVLFCAPPGVIIGGISGSLLARRLHAFLANERFKNIPERWKALFPLSILIGVATLVVSAFYSPLNPDYPPWDWIMIARFRHDKPTLDKVVALAKGRNAGVTDDAIQVGGNFLLQQAHIPGGFRVEEKTHNITFFRWGTQPLDNPHVECYKGYVYLAEPPHEQLQSLDGLNARDPETILAYRHIQGHWYLFYENSPP